MYLVGAARGSNKNNDISEVTKVYSCVSVDDFSFTSKAGCPSESFRSSSDCAHVLYVQVPRWSSDQTQFILHTTLATQLRWIKLGFFSRGR